MRLGLEPSRIVDLEADPTEGRLGRAVLHPVVRLHVVTPPPAASIHTPLRYGDTALDTLAMLDGGARPIHHMHTTSHTTTSHVIVGSAAAELATTANAATATTDNAIASVAVGTSPLRYVPAATSPFDIDDLSIGHSAREAGPAVVVGNSASFHDDTADVYSPPPHSGGDAVSAATSDGFPYQQQQHNQHSQEFPRRPSRGPYMYHPSASAAASASASPPSRHSPIADGRLHAVRSVSPPSVLESSAALLARAREQQQQSPPRRRVGGHPSSDHRFEPRQQIGSPHLSGLDASASAGGGGAQQQLFSVLGGAAVAGSSYHRSPNARDVHHHADGIDEEYGEEEEEEVSAEELARRVSAQRRANDGRRAALAAVAYHRLVDSASSFMGTTDGGEEEPVGVEDGQVPLNPSERNDANNFIEAVGVGVADNGPSKEASRRPSVSNEAVSLLNPAAGGPREPTASVLPLGAVPAVSRSTSGGGGDYGRGLADTAAGLSEAERRSLAAADATDAAHGDIVNGAPARSVEEGADPQPFVFSATNSLAPEGEGIGAMPVKVVLKSDRQPTGAEADDKGDDEGLHPFVAGPAAPPQQLPYPPAGDSVPLSIRTAASSVQPAAGATHHRQPTSHKAPPLPTSAVFSPPKNSDRTFEALGGLLAAWRGAYAAVAAEETGPAADSWAEEEEAVGDDIAAQHGATPRKAAKEPSSAFCALRRFAIIEDRYRRAMAALVGAPTAPILSLGNDADDGGARLHSHFHHNSLASASAASHSHHHPSLPLPLQLSTQLCPLVATHSLAAAPLCAVESARVAGLASLLRAKQRRRMGRMPWLDAEAEARRARRREEKARRAVRWDERRSDGRRGETAQYSSDSSSDASSSSSDDAGSDVESDEGLSAIDTGRGADNATPVGLNSGTANISTTHGDWRLVSAPADDEDPYFYYRCDAGPSPLAPCAEALRLVHSEGRRDEAEDADGAGGAAGADPHGLLDAVLSHAAEYVDCSGRFTHLMAAPTGAPAVADTAAVAPIVESADNGLSSSSAPTCSKYKIAVLLGYPPEAPLTALVEALEGDYGIPCAAAYRAAGWGDGGLDMPFEGLFAAAHRHRFANALAGAVFVWVPTLTSDGSATAVLGGGDAGAAHCRRLAQNGAGNLAGAFALGHLRLRIPQWLSGGTFGATLSGKTTELQAVVGHRFADCAVAEATAANAAAVAEAAVLYAREATRWGNEATPMWAIGSEGIGNEEDDAEEDRPAGGANVGSSLTSTSLPLRLVELLRGRRAAVVAAPFSTAAPPYSLHGVAPSSFLALVADHIPLAAATMLVRPFEAAAAAALAEAEEKDTEEATEARKKGKKEEASTAIESLVRRARKAAAKDAKALAVAASHLNALATAYFAVEADCAAHEASAAATKATEACRGATSNGAAVITEVNGAEPSAAATTADAQYPNGEPSLASEAGLRFYLAPVDGEADGPHNANPPPPLSVLTVASDGYATQALSIVTANDGHEALPAVQNGRVVNLPLAQKRAVLRQLQLIFSTGAARAAEAATASAGTHQKTAAPLRGASDLPSPDAMEAALFAAFGLISRSEALRMDFLEPMVAASALL